MSETIVKNQGRRRQRQRRDFVIVFVFVVPEAASLTRRRQTSAKQTQLQRFTDGRAPGELIGTAACQ